MPSAAKIWRHAAPDGSEVWFGPHGPETSPDDWDCTEVPRMPKDHEEWDKTEKKFKVNKEKKDKDEKENKAHNPMLLLDLIEDLQARVAALEGKTQ